MERRETLAQLDAEREAEIRRMKLEKLIEMERKENELKNEKEKEQEKEEENVTSGEVEPNGNKAEPQEKPTEIDDEEEPAIATTESEKVGNEVDQVDVKVDDENHVEKANDKKLEPKPSPGNENVSSSDSSQVAPPPEILSSSPSEKPPASVRFVQSPNQVLTVLHSLRVSLISTGGRCCS